MSPKIEAALKSQKRTEYRVLKARLEDAVIRQRAVERAIARVEDKISEQNEFLLVHKAHRDEIESEAKEIRASIDAMKQQMEVDA